MGIVFCFQICLHYSHLMFYLKLYRLPLPHCRLWLLGSIRERRYEKNQLWRWFFPLHRKTEEHLDASSSERKAWQLCTGVLIFNLCHIAIPWNKYEAVWVHPVVRKRWGSSGNAIIYQLSDIDSCIIRIAGGCTECRNLIPRVCRKATPCRHENEAEIPVKYDQPP